MRSFFTAVTLTAALALAFLSPLATAQPAPAPSASPNAPALADAPGAWRAARLLPGEVLPPSGALDHPAWRRAPVYDRFFVHSPRGATAPAHRTEVRVLYSDTALYVGINLLDPQPETIRAPLVRRDTVNRTQDFAVVYVDGIGQRRSAQFFRINAAGILADGMHTAADDSEDFSPDFDHDGWVARHEQGWSAVLRLPFSTLRYGAAGAEPWHIMVARRIPREQFWLLTSAPIPPESSTFITGLRPLQGVSLPEGSGHLTLRPGITLRSQSESPADPASPGRSRVEASLDMKWRPLPELVVDATLRPDFSQVELPVAQLHGNTRFALSFPEKRPFFFESSDLLRSPTDALYTRSLTEPHWGLRATWRSQAVQGTAFLIDDKGGGYTLLPGPFGTDAVVQPPSTTLAGRAQGTQATADGQIQWGWLSALRRYEGGRGGNAVTGPDLAWQIDSNWRLRAQWLVARTDAQPTAQGELAKADAQTDSRVFARVVRRTDLLELAASVDHIGRHFRHDTGFVAQNGVRALDARAGFGWRRVGPLNEMWLNLDANQVTALDGGTVVQRYFTPGLWMGGRHNFELDIQWRGFSHVRSSPNAPLLRENYLNLWSVFTPMPQMPFVELRAQAGRRADMVANTVRPGARLGATLRTRPWPGVELDPGITVDTLREAGRTVFRESVAQVLAVWHWDAARSLRAIVQRTTLQRLAEPGVQAAQDAGTVGSLTATWRRSAGTVFYLGASRARHGVSQVSRQNEVFFKVQFDLDELR